MSSGEDESVHSDGDFNLNGSEADEAFENNSNSEDGEQYEANVINRQNDGDDDEEEETVSNKKFHKRKSETKTMNSQSGKIFDSEYYLLPPIENLNINVKTDVEFKKFGIAESHIDFIVKIKPFDDVPHLGYETILFDSEKNPIGEIFEIFGTVSNTMYALRFNSKEEAIEKLPIGQEVYYAISDENITKTLFPEQLSLLKNWDSFRLNPGADSGSSSEEIFSDDEKEREYLAKKRQKMRRRSNSSKPDSTTDSLPAKRKMLRPYNEGYNRRNSFHPQHKQWQQNPHYIPRNNFYFHPPIPMHHYHPNNVYFYQNPAFSNAHMQQQFNAYPPAYFNAAVQPQYQNMPPFPAHQYYAFSSAYSLPPPPPPLPPPSSTATSSSVKQPDNK